MSGINTHLETEGLGAEQPDQATTVECEVVRAVDGDTVIVEVKQRYRVRLLDCWAPETRGVEKEAGAKSKLNLDALIIKLGRVGVLSVPWHRDAGLSWSLGRVLGRIWLDGQDLSDLQVESGHATKTKV